MERKRNTLPVLILAAIFAASSIGIALGAEEVPRMTKDQLKSLLGSPDVVILDVRWEGKDAPDRITGSVFEDPDQVDSWASKYPKDKKIVLYCS